MAKTKGSGPADGRLRGAWAPGGRVKRRGVAVLLLLGVVFTLMGAIPLLQALPVLLHSERAWASVQTVDQLPQPNQYRVFVDFVTVAGRKTRAPYDLSDRRRVRRLIPGDRVEVFYSIDNPQRIELYTRHVRWASGWLWLALGLLMLWLGWPGKA